MKCKLIYYTGTFNTRYVSNLVKDRLVKEGYEVDLYEIDPLNNERLDYTGYDLIGFGYPIYGFNAPLPFIKFIRKQKLPKGIKTFIYKNSGETYHANDASSVNLYNKLKRCKCKPTNEYHFMMPYNIHFKFEDKLVKEILEMDEKLLDIMIYEITHNINNLKKYKLIHRIITMFVKLQFIGGPVNSFLYKVEKKDCINCDLCIKQCPTKNIYRNKKGKIKFHHNCLMCMRCSFFCPKDAIRIGFLESWRCNGRYNFEKIKQMEFDGPYITKDTEGFFKCYIETYNYINDRHDELFKGE